MRPKYFVNLVLFFVGSVIGHFVYDTVLAENDEKPIYIKVPASQTEDKRSSITTETQSPQSKDPSFTVSAALVRPEKKW